MSAGFKDPAEFPYSPRNMLKLRVPGQCFHVTEIINVQEKEGGLLSTTLWDAVWHIYFVTEGLSNFYSLFSVGEVVFE